MTAACLPRHPAVAYLCLVRRMKRYIAWLAAAIVGAAIGASIISSFYTRAIRVLASSPLQSMEDTQRYRCTLSMAVLDRLETNQPDRAKLLLAREIAMYYKQSLGLPESPDRKKMLEHIDTLRAKCTVLNEEISKPQ